MRFVFVAFVALVGVGCGGGGSSSSSDLAMSTMSGGDMSGDMELYSLCGHPGDTGNSLGVGKFCMQSSDCAGQTASVCSTVMPIQQGPVYFCTTVCNPSSTTNMCAENASCTCLSAGACGCVPNLCRIGLFG